MVLGKLEESGQNSQSEGFLSVTSLTCSKRAANEGPRTGTHSKNWGHMHLLVARFTNDGPLAWCVRDLISWEVGLLFSKTDDLHLTPVTASEILEI